jgi:glucokinase
MSGQSDIVVGVEVAPETVQSVAFTPLLLPAGKARRSTKRQRGPAAVLDRIARCVSDAVDEGDHDIRSVRAVGLAFPGRISPGAPTLASSAVLNWESLPLEAELTQRLSLPVFAANTDELETCAAWRRELGESQGVVVALFWGGAFGGGILQGGRLLDEQTAPSFHAVIGKVRQGWSERVPPDWRSKPDRELRKAFKRGEPAISAFVENATAVIGQTVATISVKLAPEIILIGGAIMEERRGQLLESIRQKACNHLGPKTTLPMRLVASGLGDQAALLGAADLALSRCGAGISHPAGQNRG